MHKIIPSIVWTLLGSLMLLFGFNLYWEYSFTGILWLFVISERVAMVYLVTGVLSIYLGVLSWKGHRIRMLRLYIALCGALLIILSFYDYVRGGFVDIWQYIFPLLVLLVLAWLNLLIIYRYKRQTIHYKYLFKYVPGRDWAIISILVSWIIWAPIILPYESFEYLHDVEWLDEMMKDDLDKAIGNY